MSSPYIFKIALLYQDKDAFVGSSDIFSLKKEGGESVTLGKLVSVEKYEQDEEHGDYHYEAEFNNKGTVYIVYPEDDNIYNSELVVSERSSPSSSFKKMHGFTNDFIVASQKGGKTKKRCKRGSRRNKKTKRCRKIRKLKI
uniref:Uncharacterized protein n=1 Tax=viral metagenome TaxID=1070528 RepID=A0A6C0I3S0_9ZZZZ